MACYGVQENDHVVKCKYTKVQCTKKLGCPSRIYVQEFVKFLTFAVSMHMSMPLIDILKLCSTAVSYRLGALQKLLSC